jgi:hypothetical protein
MLCTVTLPVGSTRFLLDERLVILLRDPEGEDAMPPPIIRIDDDVLALIRKHARPLADTPNSVLRRVLGLPEKPAAARASQNQSRRRVRGKKTPQHAFRKHLLAVLAARGGSAGRREVIKELARRLRRELTDYDRQPISSGAPRWERTVDFERLQMTNEGLLDETSKRGVWTLSPHGAEEARRLQGDTRHDKEKDQ